ncbi:GlsB/YeaQ/YmgE family stress response membrane protein [Lacticaseibacillus mingshuiensis]|uniref:GlsB/YeaQ/YmgE family stress response membrane protein n=1 Tax=Lacticaseibacillus mingshuiensis TaxID=2799574 RepID=A0ABW4CKC4_9LACO|nr:GlsB/YeaQ/YmgE family stress response membrane protein [Lacticaseibacillus mingshuiensis]
MLHFIWVLIVGAVIGAIGSLIVGRDLPGGWIGNIIGGLVGAWVGSSLLGSWGPSVAGMAIFPAIIGAIVVVFVVSLLIGTLGSKRERA